MCHHAEQAASSSVPCLAGDWAAYLGCQRPIQHAGTPQQQTESVPCSASMWRCMGCSYRSPDGRRTSWQQFSCSCKASGSMLSKPVDVHLQTSVSVFALCDGSSPPASRAPAKGGAILDAMDPCTQDTNIGLKASCTSCSVLEPMPSSPCSALECLSPMLGAWQA